MSPTAERNTGRAWSEEEDRLLTEAVKIHGERENWKTVALSVPGRSNKACRKRWLHSLSPTVKKTAWTPEEDCQLLTLYEKLGPKWSAIARGIPGRTDDACSKRYREALDPNLKKDLWTPEEDAKLMEVFTRIGGRWGQVGQELQRSGLACRNRWRLLERKKSHRSLQGNIAHHVAQPPISFYEPSPRKDIQSLLLLTESPEGSISPLANWSPFYTPDDFTTQLEDPYPIPDDFASTSADVQNAPFQFSSSSLSAALSDPQHYAILSPVPYLIEDRCDQEFPSSSVSPASPNNYLIEDQPMPMCDTLAFSDSLDLGHIFSQVGFNSPMIHSDQALDLNGATVSPLFSPRDMTQPSALPPQGSPWTPSTPFEAFGLSPVEHPLHFNGFFCDDGVYDDLSSTTSTPINFISSLSPTSSPSAISPIDLPSNDPHTSGSLLFSPTQRPRQPASDTHKRHRRTIVRRMLKPPGTTRLSANLAITSDLSIKPYACGREKCWPSDALVSSACYSTSRELFDHCKSEHEFDPTGENPFRCALSGCNKSWKTLNGLQYHLQISTAHFRYALSTKFSSQQLRGERTQGTSATGSNSDTEATEDGKRTYVCHHPNCFKAYKQPSGLRYHLKHGHPANMPAQLPVVPPVLARQLPVKAKKMRRRAAAEVEIRQ